MKNKNTLSPQSTLKRYALSLLYPERCLYCGKVIDIRLTVCPACANSLNEIKGDICLLCGLMKADCHCKGKRSFYKAVAAPYYYEGSAGKLIRRFKFGNEPQLGTTLAKSMAEHLKTVYGQVTFDCITHVPMHKDKQKTRGYNQAEILARELGKLTSLPCICALEKICDTKPQHSLSRDERTANLLGTFSVKKGNDLTGKTILLTDDIKTTGSTLNECAKTLLIGGAQSVYCLCAAIAKASNETASNKAEKSEDDF